MRSKGRNVRLGIETLQESRFERFRDEKLGLIINPSSVNSDFETTLDVFLRTKVAVTALFAPEHGIEGELQDQERIVNFYEKKSSIPVHSLYGKHLAPTKGMLKKVDTLVFDIQDAGARFYTFVWTMELAMEKASLYKKRFIVLDRPNPINGTDIEGPVLDENYSSFVGLYSIPVRHGMTVGELASMFKGEFNIGVELEVVKMKGWERDMWFDDTYLPWISPSPNMPTLDTATVYPGMCLLEGTNISEGRGTTKPFEYFGAPWLKREAVLNELVELKGCRLRPIYFKPLWSKYIGEVCGGFQLYVTDRDVFRPVETALAIIRAIKETHPEDFKWKEPPYEFEEEKLPFDILIGNSIVREMIEDGYSFEDMEDVCNQGLEKFRKARERYLLYE
jgi:uncharacterized protein YbbC (DUF1343 family)